MQLKASRCESPDKKSIHSHCIHAAQMVWGADSVRVHSHQLNAKFGLHYYIPHLQHPIGVHLGWTPDDDD